MKKISLVIMLLCSLTVLKAQTVEGIIEKHIEAIGGKKAWSNIKSIQLKGEFISPSGSEEILSINKKGKYKGHKIINGKKITQFVFDGKDYWDFNYKNKKLIRRGEEATFRAKNEAEEFPSMLIVADDLGYKIELLGEEKIMGADCYKLKIHKGKIIDKGKEIRDEAIYLIDKETYLEVMKEEKHIRSDNVIYTYYQDYQEVSNVLMPFTINWFIDDNQFSIQVDKYIVNAKIDDKIFIVNK